MIVTTGVVAFVPATTLKFGDSGYGFFHLFIVVGFVSSTLGIFGLYKWRRTRERRWLRMHQMRFSFSYAGLLMAGVSQVATNPRFGIVTQLTPATFWATFIFVNALILSIAMVIVSATSLSAILCAAMRCGPTPRRSRAARGREAALEANRSPDTPMLT